MPSLKEITTSYNAMAAAAGLPTVSRFPSIKIAQKRLYQLKKEASQAPENVEAPENVDVPAAADPEAPGSSASDQETGAEEPTAEEVLGRAPAKLTRSQAAVNRLVEKLKAEGADVQVIVIKGVNIPVKKLARRPTRSRTRTVATDGKLSLAKRAEEMLMKGATNDELWEVFQKEYGLDDSKKSYPGWYRNSLKRQGKLPVDG